MAFRSNGPITLALPAFRGVTRQIILAVVIVFFARIVISLISPGTGALLSDLLILHSEEALRRMPWQLFTYAFLSSGLIGTLFALLSVWFFGSALEDERGSRWLVEYLLVATVGGALLACVLSWLLGARIPGLSGDQRAATLWPAVLALLLAYAHFHADQQLNFNFVLRIRAKYLAAIYVLFYLALALIGGDRFGALLALTNGVAGFCFLRFAPYAGLRNTLSEQWAGARASMLRSKRRRAAKKFAVYMREQGRDVNIDSDGKYVAPEDRAGKGKGSDGSRWKN